MSRSESALPGSEPLTLEAVGGLGEIARADWDRLANPPGLTYEPFTRWDFLEALERSGCAQPQTGWAPRHFVLRRGETPVAALPLYFKSHSRGEYVFDHSWAEAYERAGGRYYPKLLSAIPFTPANTRKFLIGEGENQEALRRALAEGAASFARQANISGVHINFLPRADWEALGALGYLRRATQQFHWENREYRDWADFMDALASRKRKTLRKEREAAQQGVVIERLTGGDLTAEHWDFFFACYQDTGARKWGRPYLNRSFFELLGERMADDVLLLLARCAVSGRPIASALNFIGGETLYGRYWGCVEHRDFLHFELCYYQAIEFALERGLKRVEAGAQGEHKLARGYEPVEIYSAHCMPDPGFHDALARYLEGERDAVADENAILALYAPFKKG